MKMIDKSEHPFPNKELELLMKIHKEELLSKEYYEVISDLLQKYLNLRLTFFMKHDCRLRSLEVFEDEEGYFFMRDQCHMPFGKEHTSRVEYCPVCGTQSRKSHLSNMTMYRRDDSQRR